ncbi:Lar family restriction alleviation protein [Morganella morganii]|uniref:Lar family restriction alleviation protein n=1 Tax=Morganella morganii TaxID=582 RepID=UPI00092D6621
MTEKTQKLKPCPFCECATIVLHLPMHQGVRSYGISCFNCGVYIKRFKEDEVIAAWNRRAPQCEKE